MLTENSLCCELGRVAPCYLRLNCQLSRTDCFMATGKKEYQEGSEHYGHVIILITNCKWNVTLKNIINYIYILRILVFFWRIFFYLIHVCQSAAYRTTFGSWFSLLWVHLHCKYTISHVAGLAKMFRVPNGFLQ